MQIFLFALFVFNSINIYANVSPSKFSSSELSHFGSLFTDEEQKRLVCDVIYTATTYGGRIDVISDMDKMTAPMVVFSWLSNIDFYQPKTQID